MKTGYFLIISILGIATSVDARFNSTQELRTNQIYNELVSESPIRSNWRKLYIGMSKAQVITLLGQPSRVDVNSLFTIWYYESFGSVTFSSRGIVDGWSEPL
jgi:outer membrane protein assembly factor BamE (lipoprotein component of BamABCDE complex)